MASNLRGEGGESYLGNVANGELRAENCRTILANAAQRMRSVAVEAETFASGTLSGLEQVAIVARRPRERSSSAQICVPKSGPILCLPRHSSRVR
jgi:hypothetical protein